MGKTILIMMHRIVRGGAETQFRYLTNELVRRGYKVVLCLENYHAGMEDDAYIAQMNSSVKIVTMGWNYYDSSNVPKSKAEKIRSLLKAYVDTFKLVKKYKVSSVLIYSRMAIMLIPVFKLYHVKIVFSERNTGKNILCKRMYSELLKRADEITANSKQASEYYSSKGFLKVHTVYNGVEPLQYKKHIEKDSFNEGLSILVPARISPIKNQMLVIHAVSLLPELNIHVDFAGKTEDEQYFMQLKEEVNERELNDRVVFRGHVANMKDEYCLHDLVVLASVAEGMPNVLLESAAAGVMAFYSNIAMNLDVMKDDSYSFAVDAPERLAELIKKWFYEKNRSAIVNEVSKRVLSEYSMETMVAHYAKLLSE